MWCNRTLNVYLHISQNVFRYVQKILKTEALCVYTVCLCLCVFLLVGVRSTVWQCEFAPIWHSVSIRVSCPVCLHVCWGFLLEWRCCWLRWGTKQQLWNIRFVSEPTSQILLPSSLQVSLSACQILSLSSVHVHTTVLTEGSERLSWPVISVGYGWKWGGNKKANHIFF